MLTPARIGMAEAERVADLVGGGAEDIGNRLCADFLPRVAVIELDVARVIWARRVIGLGFGDRVGRRRRVGAVDVDVPEAELAELRGGAVAESIIWHFDKRERGDAGP